MPDQPDQFVDMKFPTGGVDLSQGFASQGQGTTPIGQNVRTFEPLTLRGRGGARPGVSKYLPVQLPSGTNVIQHLNVIVDPQGGALLDVDNGTFADPSDAGPAYAWGVVTNSRNPGRFIRTGGSGWMEFKNKKNKKEFKYVQGNTNYTAIGSGKPYLMNTPFTLPCTINNLLIVCGCFNEVDLTQVSTPIDAFGTTFDLIASVVASGSANLIAMWYGLCAGSGANTVTVLDQGVFPFPAGMQGGIIAEWSGGTGITLDGSSSHDDSVVSWPGTPNPIPISSGSVAVSGSKELLVCFGTYGASGIPLSGDSLASGVGFNNRINTNNQAPFSPTGYQMLVLEDMLSVSSPLAGTMQFTPGNPADVGAFLALQSIAASFILGT